MGSIIAEEKKSASQSEEEHELSPIAEYLSSLLASPLPAKLDADRLPDELKDCVEPLNLLRDYFIELQEFSRALSKGELDTEPPSRNNLFCWNLKALRSNLQHLTWQAQQVAKGDYTQQVDYLGDFSASFNYMITQLSHRETTLAEEVDRSRDEVNRVAYVDPLTEVHNRRYCLVEMMRLLDEGTQFCLIFIDIDDLKRVNDRHGHTQGDAYICAVSKTLEECLRDSDSICRFGGDEFVAIMPNCTVETAFERIHGSLESLAKRGDDLDESIHHSMSFSFGIEDIAVGDRRTPTQIIDAADRKMYTHKSQKPKRA